MEGTEKRIEERQKPVWQQPSMAGSYNAVTEPAHYARFAIQPIDFIEANDLDFHQASVLKYLVRFPFKNGLEDLHKARNMLDRLIAREEKKAAKVVADLTSEAGRSVGKAPELGMPYAGEEVQPWDIYGKFVRDANLVRDAGEQVGSEPASDHAKDGANGGNRTE